MKEIIIKTNTKTTAAAFKDFIKYCKAKNLSNATIKDYISKIKHFIDYGIEVNELDEESWIDFVNSLQTAIQNTVSVNSTIKAIRVFINFCIARGFTEKFQINLIREEKKIKEIYTENELQILLKKPNMNKTNFTEFQIWVLENYLLGTGNRISTALNIKIEDVRLDVQQVKLTKTKNHTQQLLPLSDSLTAILVEYLKVRGGAPQDFLFCNTYGEKSEQRNMTRRVAAYNQKRGVFKTSCHLFRHSFATMFLRNGGDIYTLQKILGHSSIKTTEKYLHYVDEDIRDGNNRYNPLEHLYSATPARRKIKMGI